MVVTRLRSFSALIQHYGNDCWDRWDEGLVHRDSESLLSGGKFSPHWSASSSSNIYFFTAEKLKEYAHARHVRMFGYANFCVSRKCRCMGESEPVLLNDEGHSTAVAGVPPDHFSEDGQLGESSVPVDRISGETVIAGGY